MNDVWEFYQDTAEQWRWRRTAPNGNIVGAATEGYSSRAACESNAHRNGWDKTELPVPEASDGRTKRAERSEIMSTVQEQQAERSETNVEDLIVWFEAERRKSDTVIGRQNKQIRSLLYAVVGLLCVIIGILLMTMMKRALPLDLSESSLARMKGMMVVVLDPRSDEKVVVFGDTHFEFAESSLSLVAKMELDKDVQSLKENSSINVRMAGYTSANGTEEINQKLSEQRANAVRNYLIEKGIAPERITVIGYGRTKPAVFEVTPGDINSNEAMANMRVLFEVVVK